MSSGTSELTGYGRYARLQFDGDETKFEAWEARFLGYMELKTLREIIAPITADEVALSTDDVKSEDTAAGAGSSGKGKLDKSKVDFDSKNRLAYAELIQFLDETSLGLVMREAAGNGRKALEILRTHYAGKGKTRVVTLWIDFATMEKSPSETSTSYILRVEKIATSLRSAGETVSDGTLVAMAMKGLTESAFSPFVHLMKMNEEDDFSKFKTKLRNFEETERCRNSFVGVDDKVLKAYVKQQHSKQHGGRSDDRTRGGKVNNKPGFGGSNAFGGNSRNGGRKCFRCGDYNHEVKNCPQKNKKWCGICKDKSHDESNCSKRKGNNTGAKKLLDQDQPNHTFNFCMHDYEEGDYSFNFTKKPDIPVYGGSADVYVEVQKSDSDNSADEDQVYSFGEDVGSINSSKDSYKGDNTDLLASNNDISAIDNVVSSCNALLVDSGASSHICNDESKFTNIDLNFKPQTHSVELADGSVCNNLALKRGDVDVKIKDVSGNVVSAVLKDTLFIPSFPVDIFSVSSATKQGASVIFNDESSKLITPDGTNFHVDRKGKLFFLDYVGAAKGFNGKKKSLQLWHRIMGHCNKFDLMKLQYCADGMEIGDKGLLNCEVCVLGKQKSFRNREPDERAKECMELVHTDLVGPITPVARDGFRYAIAFVDDFSSATFIYFLKNKCDSARALMKFLADARPYGNVKKLTLDDPDSNSVQRVRSDNGGEFICKEFTEVLLKNRIKHERSAPHSPHQNGTVERNWHTLFDMARCLLIESKLPKELWTYAVMASVYVRNRCYNQRTKDTPYFLLTGKRPDLSGMHVFGSTCYPHVVKKKKLDACSKKGVFLGYDKGSPAYIVYYPDSKKILTHRVVTFTDVVDFGSSVDRRPVDVDDEEEFPGAVSTNLSPDDVSSNNVDVAESDIPVTDVVNDDPVNDVEEAVVPVTPVDVRRNPARSCVCTTPNH